MKQLEFQRLVKIVADLKKVQDLLANEKTASRAKKSLDSLVNKLEKKVSENGGKDGKVAKKKRAPTAFSKFVSEHMREVMASHPNATQSERMSVLSKLYHESKGTTKSEGRGRSKSRSPASSRSASPKRSTSPKARKPRAKKA